MIKKYIPILGMLLAAALSAQANYIQVANFVTPQQQDDTSIIASVESQMHVSGLVDLLRLNQNLGVDFGSPAGFTYSSPGTGQLEASWDLTGTGKNLGFIYIFGGSNANLYQISDVEQATVGDGFFITPPNQGGQIPGISHVLFLGTTGQGPGPGPGVPDGGMTIALLGLGMIAVTTLRNRLA